MKAPDSPRYEFGGPLGATGIVFGLPILMQVLYLGCNDVSGCPAPALLDPKTLSWAKLKSQIPWPQEGLSGFMSWEVTRWLFAYYFLSLMLYRIMPAQIVLGTKLRESGKPLEYRFNSFSATVVQLTGCAIGTYIYGANFPVWTWITDHYIQLLTTSTVLTYIISIWTYLRSFSIKPGNPELREVAVGGRTGRVIYDYFIGRELNPRVTLPFFGEIDIKAWLEMRPGLTGWILLNCSFIAKQYRTYGFVSDSIVVIALIQAYYVLEGQYSEAGLLSMMDITSDGQLSVLHALTWGVDVNYLGDWIQSLPFCLPTKAAGYVILPAGTAVAGAEVAKMLDGRLVTPGDAAPWGMLFTYLYSAWFGFLLIHRERRDDYACSEKYGKDWEEYKNKVRWRVLPGVY
ncbi:Delta(14)-sterol reductase erg24b [Fusarium graminearum]